MKMPSCSLLRTNSALCRFAATIALLGSTGLMAQVPAIQKTADQKWADLAVLAVPVPVALTANGKSKTPDERKTEIKQQAARSRLASDSAKNFYTQHSAHPKAAEARKIEAVAAIRGVEAGDAAQEKAALALGKTFRENANHAAADRFEVALAMDRLDLSLAIKSRKARGRAEDWKKLADNLRAEFGDLPALQSYYVEIARTADADSAAKIAADVSRSTAAPAAAKARAQVLLDRSALVGKNIALKLTTIDGGLVDLALQRNKVTVLVAWSPSDSSTLATVKRFEKSLPKDAQIVYLAMGGSANQVRKAKDDAPLPGIHCHAPAGPLARSANDALKLLYSPIPRVYVLNKSGFLAGFGDIVDLPALLLKAAG